MTKAHEQISELAEILRSGGWNVEVSEDVTEARLFEDGSIMLDGYVTVRLWATEPTTFGGNFSAAYSTNTTGRKTTRLVRAARSYGVFRKTRVLAAKEVRLFAKMAAGQ
jgi:threonine synthase